MSMLLKLTSIFALVGVLVQPSTAEDFQNLDFEDAEIVFDGNGNVIQSLALPSWETSGGFLYNLFCLGSSCTTLFDEDYVFLTPLQGAYSLALDAGTEGGENYLSQTGTVPFGATQLTLLVVAESSFALDDFQVAFDGTPLDLLTQDSRWTYDISPFAGATGELRFTTLSNSVEVGFPIIDDIQFVPEPSVLFGTAAFVLFLACSNRNSSRVSRTRLPSN